MLSSSGGGNLTQKYLPPILNEEFRSLLKKFGKTKGSCGSPGNKITPELFEMLQISY